MTQTTEEVRVGADGQIYVAPAGTTEPATVSASLNAAFGTALGYITEDGITQEDGKSITRIGAMQSFYPVRNIVTAKDLTLAFTLMQYNRETVLLAFAGGSWSDLGSGESKFSPPDPSVIEEYTVVVDWQDGDVSNRTVFPKMSNIDPVTLTLARSGAVLLPVKLSLLAPAEGSDAWYTMTDDTNLAS